MLVLVVGEGWLVDTIELSRLQLKHRGKLWRRHLYKPILCLVLNESNLQVLVGERLGLFAVTVFLLEQNERQVIHANVLPFDDTRQFRKG